MSHPFVRRLGDVLKARGLVTEEQLSRALSQTGSRLGRTLVNQGLLSEDNLARSLADLYRLPYESLESLRPAPGLFELVPAALAKARGFLPLSISSGRLRVAFAEPGDSGLAEALEWITGLPVDLALASGPALKQALAESQADEALYRDRAAGFSARPGAQAPPVDDELEGDMSGLVRSLIDSALQKRASDIHLEPYEKGTLVKYRIDGLLHAAPETLDRSHHRALVTRIKVMANLDIAENRVPQDGSFRLSPGGRDVDFRVSVVPASYGEDVVIRLLDKAALPGGLSQPRLDDLGFGPEILGFLRRALAQPQGLILVTGPTGSGKTTTIYAALAELNKGREKIVTIEDPVEYEIPGVVQIPVNEKKGLTFAKGLRSLLRHDPDRILIGEIRDPETAQIAVQSALTGHQVLSTVHANGACEVVERLAQMGLEEQSYVTALTGVLAQRLFRKLCPACRAPRRPAPGEWESYGLAGEFPRDRTAYEAVGCAECGGTGYRGRTAVGEYLEFTPDLRNWLRREGRGSDLPAAAARAGMRSLRQAALDRVLSGETSLQELRRVS